MNRTPSLSPPDRSLPRPPRMGAALALIAGLIGPACEQCPKPISTLPEEGTWVILNGDEMPVVLDSVVVEGETFTVYWRDGDGNAQWTRYRISLVGE